MPVSTITIPSVIEVNYNSCGLVFTNQETGQNEHWSQGGEAIYSFKNDFLGFRRNEQVWKANVSLNKDIFNATLAKLTKLAIQTAIALELTENEKLVLKEKALKRAVTFALRFKK